MYMHVPSSPDKAPREAAPTYNQFMGFEETVRSRPMDHLTASVAPKEVADMVAGCSVVASVMAKEKPDIVFFPLRGAGPIEWVCEEALAHEGVKMPQFVEVPLGSHADADTKHLGGLTGTEKLQAVAETVENLVQDGSYKPGSSKLLIVDEVQKGRTITQAAEAVRRAMLDHGDESMLGIVAVQDSRGQHIGDKRTQGFKRLAGNERTGFKTYVIPTPLFTVDRDKYLDVIISDTSASSGAILDRYSIAKNVESREMFRALTHAYYEPETAAEEIAMMRRDGLKDDLGSAAIQYAIADMLTDPRQVAKPSPDHRILDWWNRFIQYAEERHVA